MQGRPWIASCLSIQQLEVFLRGWGWVGRVCVCGLGGGGGGFLLF